MTKVELALILKTIDAHTVHYSSNYSLAETIRIDNVDKLKKDIIQQYEFITAEDKKYK